MESYSDTLGKASYSMKMSTSHAALQFESGLGFGCFGELLVWPIPTALYSLYFIAFHPKGLQEQQFLVLIISWNKVGEEESRIIQDLVLSVAREELKNEAQSYDLIIGVLWFFF